MDRGKTQNRLLIEDINLFFFFGREDINQVIFKEIPIIICHEYEFNRDGKYHEEGKR